MLESQLVPFRVQFTTALLRQIRLIGDRRWEFEDLYNHNEDGYSTTDVAKFEQSLLKSDLGWLYPLARAIFYREPLENKSSAVFALNLLKDVALTPFRPIQELALYSVDYGARNMQYVADGDKAAKQIKKGLESIPSMLSLAGGYMLGVLSLTSFDRIAQTEELASARNPRYPLSR